MFLGFSGGAFRRAKNPKKRPAYSRGFSLPLENIFFEVFFMVGQKAEPAQGAGQGAARQPQAQAAQAEERVAALRSGTGKQTADGAAADDSAAVFTKQTADGAATTKQTADLSAADGAEQPFLQGVQQETAQAGGAITKNTGGSGEKAEPIPKNDSDTTDIQKKEQKETGKRFSKQAKKFFSAAHIAKIGMFAALATVLQLFRFPIPFLFPSFLELNFSDIPTLIGTFALGPVSGTIIVVIKLLLKLLIQGTGSAFAGDIADLICGLSLVVPAGLIYKYKRTFKGAILALSAGSLCSTAVSLLANVFVIIPVYEQMLGFDAIVQVLRVLFPSITADNFYSYYLPLSVLPFNLLRCLIASAVTLLTYKRISRLLNKF